MMTRGQFETEIRRVAVNFARVKSNQTSIARRIRTISTRACWSGRGLLRWSLARNDEPLARRHLQRSGGDDARRTYGSGRNSVFCGASFALANRRITHPLERN